MGIKPTMLEVDAGGQENQVYIVNKIWQTPKMAVPGIVMGRRELRSFWEPGSVCDTFLDIFPSQYSELSGDGAILSPFFPVSPSLG